MVMKGKGDLIKPANRSCSFAKVVVKLSGRLSFYIKFCSLCLMFRAI